MKRQARSYSIVDHELLHGGYLERLTHRALALYLFLAVVGDYEGKSFYSDFSVGDILRMGHEEICLAKEELISEGLISYKRPYWQVMTLTCSKRTGHRDILSPLVKEVFKKRGD